MSSPCTIVSPSHDSDGPGGALCAPTSDRYVSMSWSSVLPARTSAMRLLYVALKSKRLQTIAPKNFGGVICAVAIKCANTSRLDQPVASEGAFHAVAGSDAKASTSDARSSLIMSHVPTVCLRV